MFHIDYISADGEIREEIGVYDDIAAAMAEMGHQVKLSAEGFDIGAVFSLVSGRGDEADVVATAKVSPDLVDPEKLKAKIAWFASKIQSSKYPAVIKYAARRVRDLSEVLAQCICESEH